MLVGVGMVVRGVRLVPSAGIRSLAPSITRDSVRKRKLAFASDVPGLLGACGTGYSK